MMHTSASTHPRPRPQVVEGISRVLGPRIWDNVVLGFTRASESSAPAGAQLQACSLPGGMAGVQCGMPPSGGSVDWAQG